MTPTLGGTLQPVPAESSMTSLQKADYALAALTTACVVAWVLGGLMGEAAWYLLLSAAGVTLAQFLWAKIRRRRIKVWKQPRVLLPALGGTAAAVYVAPVAAAVTGGVAACVGVSVLILIHRAKNRRPVSAWEGMEREVATWRRIIFNPLTGAGLIPGAAITDKVKRHFTEDGDEYAFTLRVRFANTIHNVGSLNNKLNEIAHTYRTRPEGIEINADTWQEADITIISSWYLNEQIKKTEETVKEREERVLSVHPWEKPIIDLNTGEMVIGVAGDGSDLIVNPFVPGQGARSWWIPGTTGAGKSAAVYQIATTLLSTGLVTVSVIDPQWGASLSGLKPYAAAYSDGLDDARQIFAHYLAEVRRRSQWLADNGKDNIEISEEFPLHLLICDEGPRIAQRPDLMSMVEEIVDLQRKCLMSIMWLSQSTLVSKAFGDGQSPLREQLLAANVVALKCGNESTNITGLGAGEEMFVDQIPDGVAGAVIVRSPAMKHPKLGRGFFLEDRVEMMEKWAQKHPWEWPTLTAPPTGEATATATAADVASSGAGHSQAGDDLFDFDGVYNKVYTHAKPGKAARIIAALQEAWPATLTTAELIEEVGCSRDLVSKTAKNHPKIRDEGHGKWKWEEH